MKRKTGFCLALLALAGCNGGGGGSGPKPVIDLSAVPAAEITYTDGDLEHLAFLLDETQQGRYASLPDGPERAEMMRIVWAELDPTPTTVENERREEHYRRLAYVREHFAIDEEPGWDRRGELLLRYGVPDRRDETPADVVEGRGLVPPKETWIYYGLGQAYRLEDPRFQGNFRDSYELAGLGASSPRDIQASRDEVNSFSDVPQGFDRSGFDDAQDPEAALQAQRLASMLEQGQEAYEQKPQSYRHDYGGEELQFVFDVVNFEGDAGKTRIDINTALWANDLRYARDDAGYYAVLTTRAAVQTPDYLDVGRGERSTRDRKDAVDNLEGRLVLDQTSIDLDPGQYRLALSVTDSLSGNVGIFKTDLWVRAFPETELRMSDIQRALDVRGGQPGDNFLKGPYQVVPYPLGTFPRDKDIYLFFEIYGLEVSPTGDSFYGVDVLISAQSGAPTSWFGSSKGRVQPGVASTFEGTGRGSTVQEYIIFDPTTFTDDVYDVEITVHDRISEKKTEGSISFGVQAR